MGFLILSKLMPMHRQDRLKEYASPWPCSAWPVFGVRKSILLLFPFIFIQQLSFILFVVNPSALFYIPLSSSSKALSHLNNFILLPHHCLFFLAYTHEQGHSMFKTLPLTPNLLLTTVCLFLSLLRQFLKRATRKKNLSYFYPNSKSNVFILETLKNKGNKNHS